MRSPWASPADPHMIGEMMDYEQSEQDVREIERELELPPDEPHPRYDDELEGDDDDAVT